MNLLLLIGATVLAVLKLRGGQCQVIRQERLAAEGPRLENDEPKGFVNNQPGRRLVSISPAGGATLYEEEQEEPIVGDSSLNVPIALDDELSRHWPIGAPVGTRMRAELLEAWQLDALHNSSGACFDSERRVVDNCKCHPSCRSCGYRNNPTEETDCISCLSGAPPIPHFSNGVGRCAPPTRPGCYNAKHILIEGCKCFPDCESCGFGDSPTGTNQCITCLKPGYDVERYGADGTGKCIPSSVSISSGSHTRAAGLPAQCIFKADRPRETVPGCQCHFSCESCRGPKIDQCFSCKSGQTVTAKYSNGAGLCMETLEELEGCYNSKAMKINSCSCDSSCKSCGYGDTPTSQEQCITCHAGLTLYQKWHDGTGYCQNASKRDCFDKDKERIDGCQCHPSCHNCGYLSSPTSAENCITCETGMPPTRLFDNGVGKCELPVEEGCYNHEVIKVQGCSCHSTCRTCGYSEEPTGRFNCIECKYPDTHKLVAHWHDGTGTCMERSSRSG